MKLVDLFCGCGGFSLGAHRAGFEVAVAYDIDKILTSSYEHNFPETKLQLQDVATLTGVQILEEAGGDVVGIFGGPPCQGFSEIGRKAVDDPRRKLLGHFFRLVSEVKPSFFVMENVRGLSYPSSRPVLDEALKLVQDEYDVMAPQQWDASQFGAATKRPRLFVIGVRKDLKKPVSLATFEPFKRAAATVDDAIADLAKAEWQNPSAEPSDYDLWQILESVTASAYAAPLRSDDRTFTGHMPTAHTADVVKRFSSVEPGQYDEVGRHPRLKASGQCPTLRAGTGSDKGSYQSVRPIHPTENRVITVREGARLQGFPDGHRFHPTVWHSFRMIGNSVSPIASEAIFKAIGAHLELLDIEVPSLPADHAMPVADGADKPKRKPRRRSAPAEQSPLFVDAVS